MWHIRWEGNSTCGICLFFSFKDQSVKASKTTNTVTPNIACRKAFPTRPQNSAQNISAIATSATLRLGSLFNALASEIIMHWHRQQPGKCSNKQIALNEAKSVPGSYDNTIIVLKQNVHLSPLHVAHHRDGHPSHSPVLDWHVQVVGARHERVHALGRQSSCHSTAAPTHTEHKVCKTDAMGL